MSLGNQRPYTVGTQMMKYFLARNASKLCAVTTSRLTGNLGSGRESGDNVEAAGGSFLVESGYYRFHI